LKSASIFTVDFIFIAVDFTVHFCGYFGFRNYLVTIVVVEPFALLTVKLIVVKLSEKLVFDFRSFSAVFIGVNS